VKHQDTSWCSTEATTSARRAVRARAAASVRAAAAPSFQSGRAAHELKWSTYCCVEQNNLAYLRLSHGKLRVHRAWEVRALEVRAHEVLPVLTPSAITQPHPDLPRAPAPWRCRTLALPGVTAQ